MSDFHTEYRKQLEGAAEALFPVGAVTGPVRAGRGAGSRSPRRWRASRSSAVAAAIAAVAGLAVLAGLAFTGGESQPAYAVTLRADGSVALTMSEIVGVGPANARMIQLGVPVRLARAEEGCTAHGHSAAISGAGGAEESRAVARAPQGSRRRREEILVAMRLRSERELANLLKMADVERGGSKPGIVQMIIHPAAIPTGDTLLLAFRNNRGGVGGSIGLYRDPPPPCVRLG